MQINDIVVGVSNLHCEYDKITLVAIHDVKISISNYIRRPNEIIITRDHIEIPTSN